VKTTTINNIAPEERIAWRPSAWLAAAGHPFSRPTLYNEIHRGVIDARKVGKSTIILTSPRPPRSRGGIRSVDRRRPSLVDERGD
jgi:hypothetical protein